MPVSFKIKILALSSSKSAKESFFKQERRIDRGFRTDYKLTVGVDILTADCIYDPGGESVTLSIWDIGNQQRFEFIRFTFYRGASGCLIFCSSLDNEERNELSSIVSEIRSNTGEIPIFLVQKREEPELNLFSAENFVEEHELDGHFVIPDEISLILRVLTRTIIERKLSLMNPEETLDGGEKTRYRKFIRFFKICPCCTTHLHESYLRAFFFSNDPEKKRLKNRLLVLIEESSLFGENIDLGIPCCSCYKKIFS